ncbi:amino acid ABC transporter permease [Allobaculum mucilyticum]|uniref:amino acid ABC transporter permease n=1 Tax=Allobaculum mucilyticum TaxID=2834459 RepID=UPI001E47F373|nr:amino acid ABC transporter permease [Allobaculum mucilyticum]UNT96848.1 amino acid ABC transporter permease [Allobaculum mucilyticum]
MSIDWSYAWQALLKNWPMFWHGVKITIAFAVVGTVFGFLIGLVIGAIRAVPIDPLDSPAMKALKKVGRALTGLYIWVFRGTPMMIQACFIYYLLRPVLNWSPITAGFIIISINTGAYMAEILRSGIQSVDPGQVEACKAVGMTNFQAMVSVVFPQAIKNTFPAIGNQLVVNLKDSCMMNAISVTELFFQASSIAGSNMRFKEIYLDTAVIYLILTTLATWILNLIEHRMNRDHTESSAKPAGKKKKIFMEMSS